MKDLLNAGSTRTGACWALCLLLSGCMSYPQDVTQTRPLDEMQSTLEESQRSHDAADATAAY